MAKRTPLKAIRARCIDCCAGQMHEVRLCPAVDCPLWEYRMGKRPKKTEAEEIPTEKAETLETLDS